MQVEFSLGMRVEKAANRGGRWKKKRGSGKEEEEIGKKKRRKGLCCYVLEEVEQEGVVGSSPCLTFDQK